MTFTTFLAGKEGSLGSKDQVTSMPISRVELGGPTFFRGGGPRLLSFTEASGKVWVAREWSVREGAPSALTSFGLSDVDEWDIDILKRIRGLTNLRLVPGDASDTGYRIDVAPFPGWRSLPTW